MPFTVHNTARGAPKWGANVLLALALPRVTKAIARRLDFQSLRLMEKHDAIRYAQDPRLPRLSCCLEPYCATVRLEPRSKQSGRQMACCCDRDRCLSPDP